MRYSALASTVLSVVLLASCSAPSPQGFTEGDAESCTGTTVVVNYGLLSPERDTACVEFEAERALASDVLSLAGFGTEGTGTYGDQIVCRVNGLPSESEAFEVEGEDPYIESCADMPPAFAYWALWVKAPGSDEWAYAEEGVGTLMLEPGSTIGLVFSTGGDTPTPSDP